MNNYQAQQFWNDINGVIGFATSIVVLGFLFGMTRSITKPFGNPDTKALPPAQEVKGTCYEDAWRFLIKQEEGELVHGTVLSVGKRIVKHAWVDLPTGYVWEPQTNRFYSAMEFQQLFSPIDEHRYTVEEAAIMAARTHNLGPWSEEERARWLPEHQSNPIGTKAALTAKAAHVIEYHWAHPEWIPPDLSKEEFGILEKIYSSIIMATDFELTTREAALLYQMIDRGYVEWLPEHHSSSNVITSKLPKDITIPPKEIREDILKDIRRGGYGPKWALETLSGYYSIEPPTLVTMPELNVISSCLYGEAEDTWGWGAEGMYMPREKAWRICRIRTNEDFIVINPETDVTEYPYHLIHEFYHHLFKCKPTLLRGYERDEEYAVYMIVHEWIAGE